jgi:hypothetical protein
MEQPQDNLVWSEEELAWVPLPARPSPTGAGRLASGLRRAVLERGRRLAAGRAHELTRAAEPAVIFAPDAAGHGNFIEASYRRIVADDAWRARLTKAHTGKRQARATGADEEVRAWCELDTATSSDALLMNIFCYPRVLSGGKLPALLGVEPGLRPEFGFQPRLARERELIDRTEIDMRLGSLLVEAKLTEADFQTAPLRLLERYPAFDRVFEREALAVGARGVRSYQLLRGVLAAEELGGCFAVLCDRRRPDLIEAWHSVMRAVRSYELRTRLKLHTWQEIAAALPLPLRVFLAEKYGVEG